MILFSSFKDYLYMHSSRVSYCLILSLFYLSLEGFAHPASTKKTYGNIWVGNNIKGIIKYCARTLAVCITSSFPPLFLAIIFQPRVTGDTVDSRSKNIKPYFFDPQKKVTPRCFFLILGLLSTFSSHFYLTFLHNILQSGGWIVRKSD